MNEQPNLKQIKEIAGGDGDFERKLVEILKREFPLEIETYNNLFLSGDLLKTAEIVHKIKHKIRLLGLEKSYDLAIKYEEELKMGDSNLSRQFEVILDRISIFIQAI